MEIQLTGHDVNVDQVWAVAEGKAQVLLANSAKDKMQESRDYIESRINAGEVMYGVNTGFGAFSNVTISKEDIEKLQVNLIRSHCAGVGKPFTKKETRAIMFLRANALARGHSACRVVVVEKILEFLNEDIVPVVPSQGSVGASGDLAPLSHLALALIGEGEVWHKGPSPIENILTEKRVQPLKLQAKEGLSLINGCQVMTAVGLLNLYKARRLCWMTDLAGAMTLEALQGTRRAFHPLIAPTRPHPGEGKTARNMIKILGETSPIADNHTDCSRVQDAYSLRCIPAVHGAAKDVVRRSLETLEIEANSSTDNPLVFAKDGEILSCGNFHGEPVAFALDFLGIAISAMASISECRIEKLINPNMSGLPAFLAPEGGLNSGLMIVQVAAAALVSENKILSHPASVDSIPTSADKEDHVSMGTISARKFSQILNNAEKVTSMEFLCGHQALGFLKPLEPAAGVKAVHDYLINEVPFAQEDRVFSKDVNYILNRIQSGAIFDVLHKAVGDLEW